MRVDTLTDGRQRAAYSAPGLLSEPLPAAQTRRFDPHPVFLSPRQSLFTDFPAPRQNNDASFDVREKILPAMMGNTLGIIDRDGSVHEVESSIGGPFAQQYVRERDGSRTLVHSVPRVGESRPQWIGTSRLMGTDGIIVPVAPWGDSAVMVMHMDPAHPTLPSIPERQLDSHMRVQSAIVNSFQDGERPVYWGNNVSPGNNLTESHRGIGLQTINLEHDIVFSLPRVLDGLTQEDIVSGRSGHTWDDGISRYLGGRVAADLNKRILPDFGTRGRAEADTMGVHAEVDITPADFGTAHFARRFWGGLMNSMHNQLRQVHSTVFRSDLDEVHRFAQQRLEAQRPMTDEEQKTYASYFERRWPQSSDSADLDRHIVSHLDDIYNGGDGRYAPAMTGAIRFNPDGHGALVVATFGIVNAGIPGLGPVESLGLGLQRPPDPVAPEIMEQKRAQIYTPAMENVLYQVAA